MTPFQSSEHLGHVIAVYRHLDHGIRPVDWVVDDDGAAISAIAVGAGDPDGVAGLGLAAETEVFLHVCLADPDLIRRRGQRYRNPIGTGGGLDSAIVCVERVTERDVAGGDVGVGERCRGYLAGIEVELLRLAIGRIAQHFNRIGAGGAGPGQIHFAGIGQCGKRARRGVGTGAGRRGITRRRRWPTAAPRRRLGKPPTRRRRCSWLPWRGR